MTPEHQDVSALRNNAAEIRWALQPAFGEEARPEAVKFIGLTR